MVDDTVSFVQQAAKRGNFQENYRSSRRHTGRNSYVAQWVHTGCRPSFRRSWSAGSADTAVDSVATHFPGSPSSAARRCSPTQRAEPGHQYRGPCSTRRLLPDGDDHVQPAVPVKTVNQFRRKPTKAATWLACRSTPVTVVSVMISSTRLPAACLSTDATPSALAQPLHRRLPRLFLPLHEVVLPSSLLASLPACLPA